MQVNGNGCEDSPSRYHITPARTPGATPAATTASYTLPGTPTLLEEHSVIKSESCIHLHGAAWVKSEIITVLELFLFFPDKFLLNSPPSPWPDNMTVHRSSPQTVRRDIGLAVTHR